MKDMMSMAEQAKPTAKEKIPPTLTTFVGDGRYSWTVEYVDGSPAHVRNWICTRWGDDFNGYTLVAHKALVATMKTWAKERGNSSIIVGHCEYKI